MMELGRIVIFLVTTMILYLPNPIGLHGAELARLPRVFNAGVIPLQWELSQPNNSTLNDIKRELDAVFYSSIQSSSKFVVLNRHLTESLWATEAGRAELEKDFEAHSFLNLTIVEDQELMRLSIRLLDLSMKSYLFESSVYPRALFLGPDAAYRQKVVKELCYQLINRIPLDAYITSIQGSYVTLSRGENQDMRKGNKYKVYRPFVATVHPVLGTWNTFKLKMVGEIEIIDIKEITAIAKIVSQIFPGAIEITDGIVVPSNPSRNIFAENHEVSDVDDSNNEKISGSSLVAGAAGVEPKPSTGTIRKNQGQSTMVDADSGGDAPARSEEAGQILSEESSPNASPSRHDESSAKQDDESDYLESLAATKDQAQDQLMSVLGLLAHQADVFTGIRMWQMGGSANVRSKFSLLPINFLGLRIHRNLIPKVFVGFGGALNFGKTQKGSYSGFDGEILIYYDDEATLFSGSKNKYRVGVIGEIEGRGINSEPLGGGDLMHGGGFARVYENFAMSNDLGKPIEAYGEFDLYPLSLGRLGIKGSNYTVKSSLGWGLKLGGFLPQSHPKTWQWGLETGYLSYNYTLSGSKEITASRVTLMGMGRYRF